MQHASYKIHHKHLKNEHKEMNDNSVNSHRRCIILNTLSSHIKHVTVNIRLFFSCMAKRKGLDRSFCWQFASRVGDASTSDHQSEAEDVKLTLIILVHGNPCQNDSENTNEKINKGKRRMNANPQENWCPVYTTFPFVLAHSHHRTDDQVISKT